MFFIYFWHIFWICFGSAFDILGIFLGYVWDMLLDLLGIFVDMFFDIFWFFGGYVLEVVSQSLHAPFLEDFGMFAELFV